MDDLVQFVNARLDEAEERARRGYYNETLWERFTTEAHLHAWKAWREYFPRERWDVDANDAVSEAARDGIRARITAHEADRTAQALREIDAKRKILTLHRTITRHDFVTADGQPAGPMQVCHECDANSTDADWPDSPCWTLRYLAAPYADHEDYQEDWQP
jgi:hypothetical protein